MSLYLEEVEMRALINLLQDGEFHPGDELGSALEISRAAVWKQVQKLQDAGLDIQSVRGKGYRLAYPMEWLDGADIKQRMPGSALSLLKQLQVSILEASTNDLAMKMASDGVGSGYVCLAEQQTAGRGRRGREWVSPFGSNLYLSTVWEFYQGASQLEGLSLATGVAVAKALAGLGVDSLGLKWPNDILVSGAKLCGILLEMTGDPSGRCQVVLGVGVNHRLPRSAGQKIDQPWTRIEDVKPGIGRNQLAASIISELLFMLDTFSRAGFAAFYEDWQSLDIYMNKSVVIKTGTTDVHGVARGVDSTGGLILELPDRTETFKGGELSLRGAD
ncbi:bifunctional biotin--[acetyl-CoA-carboxylase] ligase/biotin operon repressor BirA [Ketobacter sp.]